MARHHDLMPGGRLWYLFWELWGPWIFCPRRAEENISRTQEGGEVDREIVVPILAFELKFTGLFGYCKYLNILRSEYLFTF
jgi:hypothetical protein